MNQTTEQMADIRDIKGLEHFSYSPLYYIVPTLLFAVLAYFLWRKIKKKSISLEMVIPPSVPPDETALRELESLKNEGLFEGLGEKQYNFRISEIFRNYLEARYGFGASDMTTEEILSNLIKKNATDNAHREAIKKILRETDKVKFAKFRPGAPAAFNLIDLAKVFIKETVNEERGPR